MSRLHLLAALAASFLAGTALAKPPTPATSPRDARIEAILAQTAKLQSIPQVVVSADGSHLAWRVTHQDADTLHLAAGDGHGTHAVAWPKDACKPEDMGLAPQGATLAVLTRCTVDAAGRKPIHGAIWLLDAASKTAPRKLTELAGFADGLQWSHDGKALLFRYVPGATRLPFATAAGNPRVGVIGEQHEAVQQVARVALAGGAPQVLTPADLYIYEFDLAPDGRHLAYTAAPPPGDNNWWTAKLYTQTLDAEAKPELRVDPATVTGSLRGLQMQQPTWAPDGRAIYFVGGLMSDQGADAGDLYRVATDATTPVNLTPGIKVTLHQFTFLAPDRLLFSQESLGHVEIAEYALAGDRATLARRRFTVPGSLWRYALATGATPRIAYVASSFERAPEVYVGPLGDAPPPAVTAINAALRPMWGHARSVTWQSGGTTVQGWLLYPAHYDPAKRWPMVVSVHGGPTFANLSGWQPRSTALSAFGYFVFLPNPRGSTGHGEAFVQAIRNQMGWGDLDDILAGIDAVEKIAPIDDARLGMTGWSYGGFMSMFAPTRTQRFKAVVAGAGLSNWQSYYGQNQIDQWMIPFFGATVYADPAAYAKSSAIDAITKAHTPALIVVGEFDEECPAPQSFEYWHALKTLGVPARLVVYPGEGHRIASHEHQADILRRTLDWFGRYLATPAK